jgi:hypothetical protein
VEVAQQGRVARPAAGEAEGAGAREGGPGQVGSPSLPLGPYRVAKKRAMEEEEEEMRATTASAPISMLPRNTFLFILENCTATFLLLLFYYQFACT